MRLRRRLLLLAAAGTAAPLGTLAPRAAAQGKPKLVGLLWNDSVKPSPHVATLAGALRELGWADGRNLRIDDRVALEGYATYGESAAALVRARCDVIVTFGATATLAAAKATQEIPIAMLIGVDPLRAGLAKSFARPGGNVTGVLNLSQGLIGKRLELLRELVPGLKEFGVLVASVTQSEGRSQVIDDIAKAAAALGMAPRLAVARGAEELGGAIAGLATQGLRAVYVSQGTLLAAHSRRIVALVSQHRLVAIYPVDRYAESGGLIVYAPSSRKGFVRLAACVDRLLRGARAAETPIEQLSEFELVINLRAAREFGLRIPQSILQRADRAIE